MLISNVIILVSCVSLMLNSKDDLIKVFQAINHYRKVFFLILSVFTIFIGCFGFTLEINEDSIMFLIGYFYIALIYYGIFSNKLWLIFSLTFLLQVIGLICHIMLEWGEVTLMNSLTLTNIGMYISVIPIIVTLMCFLLGKYMCYDFEKK